MDTATHTDTPAAADTSTEETSLGAPPHVEGLLCYALGFITGIVFYLLEKKSTFVRFHAVQSTVVFLALFVVQVVVAFIPVVGSIASMVLGLGGLLLWIFLMVKAFRGERYALPRIGDIATKHAG